MSVVYVLLFFAALSLLSTIRQSVKARSEVSRSTEDEVTITDTVRRRKRIDASLGEYVKFKEIKNR